MKKIVFCCVFLTIVAFSLTKSYKILAVFPFNGKSHDVMFSALVKGLLKRHHEIDVITHYPMKNFSSNYRVIVDLSKTMNCSVNTLKFGSVRVLSENMVDMVANKFGNEFCDLMGLEEIQTFIKNPPKYDLVIVEVIFFFELNKYRANFIIFQKSMTFFFLTFNRHQTSLMLF